MRKFLLRTAGILVLSSSLSACTPLVKTDLKNLTANPDQYQGKRVVVTTDLRTLVEKPEDYFGKNIEVTGHVSLKGLRSSGDWSFILKDEEGKSVRCYEWQYGVEYWSMLSVVLRRAERENGQVTVVGKLEKDKEIELDWIVYQDQYIDTDYVPYRLPVMINGWYGLSW